MLTIVTDQSESSYARQGKKMQHVDTRAFPVLPPPSTPLSRVSQVGSSVRNIRVSHRTSILRSFHFRCGLRIETLETLKTASERNENSVFAPWAVSIGYYDGDGDYIHGCTGSIIAENIILTAAHCTLREDFNIVRVGVTDLRFAGSSDIEISESLVHPDYNPGQSYYDIAVLYLKTCLTFSYNTIQPICLPSEDSSLPNPDIFGRFGTTVTTQG